MTKLSRAVIACDVAGVAFSAGGVGGRRAPELLAQVLNEVGCLGSTGPGGQYAQSLGGMARHGRAR